jgi:hypothetical protein
VSFQYVKNIIVNGDGNPYPGGAADYERRLRSILDTIKSTGTGRTVLGFFALPPGLDRAARRGVIVHELFHAMRQAFGALRNIPMPNFKTTEELYSIFVENMYANEKGLPLRADKGPRNRSPDHSMAHNPAFHGPMRDLFAMMPTIGNALARVNSSYNPFRDWKEFSRTAH